MAICSDSVLTGQEGSITFRPPGTSVCVRDYSAFGTDGNDTHITLECGSDFRVNDIVVFTEESGGNLDSALLPGAPRIGVAIGSITALGDHVSGSSYTPGTYTDVALTGGTGTGATATIVVGAGGGVDSATLTAAGEGYLSTDQLSADDADLGSGGGAGFVLEVETVFQPQASGAAYFVVGTGTDAGGTPWIAVSSTAHGTAIAMNGDGGTGSADNDLPAHINIVLADWLSVCGVNEFSLEIERDELDVTTLPCQSEGDTAGCDRLASFRSTQAGYASATGSMTVYFTGDQENIANRLLSSSILKSQQGAQVRLYVNTAYKDGVVDNDSSLYIEAEISITGMSFSVNPDDPTSAELSFSVTKMVSAFGLTA